MYLNCSKTKMICILVFFNYHFVSSSLAVCYYSEPLCFKHNPSANLPCDCTHILAKSCSICPQFSYATTLLFSTQVTSYSFESKTPWSPSTPKSGNICGGCYIKTNISLWCLHLWISFALPSSSGQILNSICFQQEENRTYQSNTSRTLGGVIVLILGLKGITQTQDTTKRHISQLSLTLITCVGLKYTGIDKKNIGKPFT